MAPKELHTPVPGTCACVASWSNSGFVNVARNLEMRRLSCVVQVSPNNHRVLKPENLPQRWSEGDGLRQEDQGDAV